MATPINKCPAREVLVAFCDGALPDGQMEQVGAHFESCGHCSDVMETLELKQTGTARHWLRSAELDDGQMSADELERIEKRLAGIASASEPTRDPSLMSVIAESGQHADPEPDVPDSHSSLHVELPERIGPYFIVRHLGRGGMADVYLGRDDRRDRLVAIKTPRKDKQLSHRQLNTFLDEARHVSELHHDSIVPVYDFDRTDDGTCYVVMKYVPGKSLTQYYNSAPLSRRETLRIIRELAVALAFMHDRKCYHRDIKPDNILIDDAGKVWLADFGLLLRDDTRSLHEQELAGTLPYMSPEQLRCAADQIDGRSDIWSLGVVMFELLTGSRPFPEMTYEERLATQLSGISPNAKVNRKQLAPWLAAVCEKCLQWNPENRFETAQHFLKALRSPLNRALRLCAIVTTIGLAAYFGILFAREPDFIGFPEQLQYIAYLDGDDNYCQLDPDANVLRVRSEHSTAVIQLLRTVTRSFKCRIQIDASVDAVSGVYWGLPDPEDSDGEQVGMAIRFIRTHESESSVVLCRIKIENSERQTATRVSALGRSEQITVQNSEMFVELTVNMTDDTKPICKICVNNEQEIDLSDRLSSLNWQETTTGFGVISSTAPVEFSDFQFTPLNGLNQ